MSDQKNSVISNLSYASVSMSCAPEVPGYNGSLYAISEETKERIERDMSNAGYAVAELIKALKIAVRQNQHDMLMTGEELRICEAALSRIGGDV